MDGKRNNFWHQQLLAGSVRSVPGSAALLLVLVASPGAVNAQYTESFQSWSATSASTWQTKDLSGAPFNVPANAVVEVEILNSDLNAGRLGGVRAVGSSLERKSNMHAPWISGFQPAVMHVQSDSSSQIQHYAEDTTYVTFVLLGYWTSGTYVERFDTFTAGASGSWQQRNLCTYGVGASHVAEIVIANNGTSGRLVGARTNGSSISRRFTLDRGYAGADNLVTMFVKTDTSPQSIIELYTASDADVDFYLVGYWSVAPLAYTETFTDVGSPSASATWQNKDLTASGVPDSAITEFVLANEDTGDGYNMGVRANGSSLSRLTRAHRVSSSGATTGRMHVATDATATIEWYHVDLTQAHRFYLLGYWDACDTSIAYVLSDLGAVTTANSSLGMRINSSEHLAGFEEDANGDPDAWFQTCGTFTALGVLGGADAEARGINNNDMVVGWSDDGSGNRRAFTWTSGGGMTNLGTVSGRTDSEAIAVNSSSEVVGSAMNFGTPSTNRLAFLYLPSAAYTLSAGMNSLGTLGGGQSVAMDINDSGQVVGGAEDSADYFRPFRWANGVMTDLGTLGGENGAMLHRAQAINATGNVVGQSYTAGGAAHAFYYNGSMTDLGVLTGGDTSWALGINDSNVVVGTSNVSGGAFHAFVWDGTNGLRDLNNLVSGTWTLTRATDINNNGDVVGWGTNPSGDVRAFQLTPSCSAGGGGAAFAPGFPPDLGVLDESGRFEKSFLGADGQPVAGIFVTGGEPGATLNFTVTGQNENAGGQLLPTLGTLEGFVDGVALARTLEVAASMAPGSFQATVTLFTSMEELSELHLDPEEAALHVLDPTQGSPPGRWMRAGKDIGEAAPTGVVGKSGFVVYADGTVDYWSVRDEAGIFAVGKPERDATGLVRSGRPAGLCGIGLPGPVLLVTFVFFIRRTGRRAHCY